MRLITLFRRRFRFCCMKSSTDWKNCFLKTLWWTKSWTSKISASSINKKLSHDPLFSRLIQQNTSQTASCAQFIPFWETRFVCHCCFIWSLVATSYVVLVWILVLNVAKMLYAFIQWYLWTVWRSGKRIELGLLCKCGLCSGCIYSITAPPYLAPFPFSHLENWDIGVSNNLQHYGISTKTCPPKFSTKNFPQKTWWSREGNNRHICPISPTSQTYRDKWSNRYRYHDNDGFPKWSLIKESTHIWIFASEYFLI